MYVCTRTYYPTGFELPFSGSNFPQYNSFCFHTYSISISYMKKIDINNPWGTKASGPFLLHYLLTLGWVVFCSWLHCPKTPLDFFTQKCLHWKDFRIHSWGPLLCFLSCHLVFFLPPQKKSSTPRPSLGGFSEAAPIGHCYTGVRMRQRRILSTHLKGRWGNDIPAMGPPDQWDGKNTPIYSCVEIILISENI